MKESVCVLKAFLSLSIEKKLINFQACSLTISFKACSDESH